MKIILAIVALFVLAAPASSTSYKWDDIDPCEIMFPC